jgi:hypothetical protein
MTESVKQAPIMEMTTLMRLIGRIGKRGQQVHDWIQTAAVNAVAYSIVDRNITPAKQLVGALNAGNRKDALVRYLEKFGNLAWAKNEQGDYDFAFFEVKVKGELLQWTPEYAKMASEFVWSKAIKPPVPKSMYDVAAALSQLIDAAHRAVKKQIPLMHADILSQLEQVQADLHHRQYSAEKDVREALRQNAVEDKEAGKEVTPAPATVETAPTEPVTT